MSRIIGPLVVILGPTAVGKTDLSIALAEAFGGEVLSADSRQVYRLMDIGTAKPTPTELARVPHHLIDILYPDEHLTVAQFQQRAYETIDEVLARGRLPLLVGGTGQYVHAVVEGWGVPRVPPNQAQRAELEAFGEVYGPTALHARLASIDPDASATIDRRNLRRVVRALEVYLETGQPITRLRRKKAPPYLTLLIGLTRPRDQLYRRVDLRVDQMMADGLLGEVERLRAAGYGWDLPSMSSLGYRQFEAYFSGKASLVQAVAEIKHETRRFIRRQYTWFRLDDPGVLWFDLEVASTAEVIEAVRSWLDMNRESFGL